MPRARKKARTAAEVINRVLPVVAFQPDLPAETRKELREVLGLALETLRMIAKPVFPHQLLALILPTADALVGADLTDLDLSWLAIRSADGQPVKLADAVLDHTNFAFSHVRMDFTDARLRTSVNPVVQRAVGVARAQLPPDVDWEAVPDTQDPESPAEDGAREERGDLRDFKRLIGGIDLTQATEFYHALLDGVDLTRLRREGGASLHPAAFEEASYSQDSILPQGLAWQDEERYRMRRVPRRADGNLQLTRVPDMPLAYDRGALQSGYQRLADAVAGLRHTDETLRGDLLRLME